LLEQNSFLEWHAILNSRTINFQLSFAKKHLLAIRKLETVGF